MTSTDEISRLLAAERAASPPAGVADAGLHRLLGSMAAHAAPLPVAVGALQLGWSALGKWLGVGFAVGLAGAGAAAYVSSPSGAAVTALPAVSSSRLSPAAAVMVAAPAAAGAPDPSSVAPPYQPGKPAAGRPEPSATPVPSAPTFDEELRLIAAAKRELDAGRAHLAVAWLDEHRQRFPSGVFGHEREGLSILARCSGRPNPALARDFARKHPESPMLMLLQRRCAGEVASQAGAGDASISTKAINESTRLGEPTKD